MHSLFNLSIKCELKKKSECKTLYFIMVHVTYICNSIYNIKIK